jgi:acetate kinase
MLIAGGLVLTLNAGSSSLKFALFDPADSSRRIATGKVDRIGEGARDHAQALGEVVGKLAPAGGFDHVAAVGHRVVHGGERLVRSTRVTPAVLGELRRLSPLDPDHMPAEIAIIEKLRELAPAVPQVACFDTAFHATMDRAARLLAIPRRYMTAGVRRYGFHGLSYTYLMEELARVAGDVAARGRVVLAHLGSGASLAAMRDGRCVDTTMGFTPNSGVPMGTRAGDLDPGAIVHLLRTEGLDADALDVLLSRESGLLGVSETSADMRDLLEREASDPRASDAVALFCWQVRKAIGALAATIGGLDTLVFAGGIGENAAPVRARVAAGLEHLGVHFDVARNDAGGPVVSADASPCTVRVIHTDEEAIIARETVRVLGDEP